MRIMLYMDWSLAMQFLEPVYHYLKDKHPEWNYYFVANDDRSKKECEVRGYPYQSAPSDYDWAICCDGWSACPTRNRIVTFHGMASKGGELSSNRAGQYEGVFIAMSPYIKDILINRMGVKPENVLDGGLTKFDTIKNIPHIRKKNPRILYAPTFNGELSSLPVLKQSILQLSNLTLHLHSYIENAESDYQIAFRNFLNKNKRSDDWQEDITELYLKNDVVIADNGSTVVEPLALGRMVIRVRNPKWYDFYCTRKVREEEFLTYPEVYYPDRYAFDAKNIDDIKRIIREELPNYTPPNEEIISNIGNYKVSKVICDYIEQS